MSNTTPDHWSKVANAYAQLESPLHPCPEDIAIIERLVAKGLARCATAARSTKLNALLLGVTPDIATMAWPPQTSLLAIDSSEGMLRMVWPGDQVGVREAKLGNWLDLPLEDSSCSIVVGDGSFNCPVFPTEVEQLAASVARVLQDDGILVLRLFVQPAPPQNPATVCQALAAGQFHTFDGFKFLLLASLADASYNVWINEVWRYWTETKLDRQAILRTYGWAANRLEAFAYYQNSLANYSFPTLQAAEQLLANYFEKIEMVVPSYQIGDCCPILLLRKRSSESNL